MIPAATSATPALDAYAQFIMDAFAAVNPDILRIDEIHLEVIRHELTSSFLSRIRVVIIDWATIPDAEDDGTANIVRQLLLAQMLIKK